MDDARLRVTLLGGFGVYRGDAALVVPGARLQGLAARLALAGGRAVEPGVLVDAIWPEDPPVGAGHALQALVSRLRRALGRAGDVAQVAGGYRLDVAAGDVDALRFERLAADGRERLRAGDPAAAAGLLGAAVALWASPAAVAAVAPAVATGLAHAAVEAAADLAEAELALGRATEAGEKLAALLAEHPMHERAAGLLMDALAAQGRQAEALVVYEEVRKALAEELGADPGAALRERHVLVLRAGTVVRNNLPAPLTSFIGRDDDLARIDALLAAGRLVTVVGPGGAGKTRLALEAARRHRDGTWMVDLASVTEPAKVGAAVLAAAGLRGGAMFESKVWDELDVLAERLGGRAGLLLVDNCEHLIDAVAHLLSALLARCPRLRVLATSREPLAVDGEALVPLGPLTLPEPGAGVAEARRAASVRLFAERAAAVRPGFEVDEAGLPAVVRVVCGLDGMPLALELAAARLRTMSLGDLADGLSDRFRLLTTGSRTALPRHRTLRAVIAWSWDLLGDHERTVAERVSVLPGGVTPASATAVCAGTGVPAGEIPELLAGLVDRSLLQLVPDGGRYRMLETIREYGLETLGERATGVRDLAARHFAGLVAHHDPLLRGPEQLTALAVLRAEYDNVLAALRHLCATGDAIGLAIDLAWYWQTFGRSSDAAYWLGEALAAPGPPGVQRDIAEGMRLLATVAAQGALVDGSIEAWRAELRTLAGRLLSPPDLPGFGGALTVLMLASVEGMEAPAVVRRLADGPDVWLAGLARLFRARSAENEGRLDQVRGDVTAALECFGAAGDRWGLAATLPLRALLRQYDGDLDGARTDLTEAQRLAGEFGSLSPGDEFFVDLRWIDLYARLGDPDRAAERIGVARERARRSTSPEMTILLDALEAGLRVRTGELDRARELIESAEAVLSEQLLFGGDRLRALVGGARGALRLELGDLAGAEEALRRAYAAAVHSEDMPIMATVAVTMAGLHARRGRHRDLAAVLGAAARLRGAHDRTDPEVRRLSGIGRDALGDEGFASAYELGWESRRVDYGRVDED